MDCGYHVKATKSHTNGKHDIHSKMDGLMDRDTDLWAVPKHWTRKQAVISVGFYLFQFYLFSSYHGHCQGTCLGLRGPLTATSALEVSIKLRSTFLLSNIDHSCICYETRGNCVTLKNNIIIIMNERPAFWEMMGTLNGLDTRINSYDLPDPYRVYVGCQVTTTVGPDM